LGGGGGSKYEYVFCRSQQRNCRFTLTELNETKTKTNDNAGTLQIGITEAEKIDSNFCVSNKRTKSGKENSSEWKRDKKW
jgi:hypothetical protein